MEQRIRDLEEIIIKQNNQLAEMQSKMEILEDRILRVNICKVSNGKFPYYEFVLSYGITPNQQSQLGRLFVALSEKIAGNSLPTNFKKNAGFCTDFLFDDNPIHFDNVKYSIKSIWPITDDELPLLLIKSMKHQGLQVDVCEYLLSQITL